MEHLNCSLIKIFIKDNNSPYDLSYQFYAITDYIHFRLYRTMSTKSFHNTVLVTISFSLSSCVNSGTHFNIYKMCFNEILGKNTLRSVAFNFHR